MKALFFLYSKIGYSYTLQGIHLSNYVFKKKKRWSALLEFFIQISILLNNATIVSRLPSENAYQSSKWSVTVWNAICHFSFKMISSRMQYCIKGCAVKCKPANSYHSLCPEFKSKKAKGHDWNSIQTNAVLLYANQQVCVRFFLVNAMCFMFHINMPLQFRNKYQENWCFWLYPLHSLVEMDIQNQYKNPSLL